ncbi:MAG: serine/threonine protein kinase, partial [Candidatus Kapaibacterium sp.]
MDTTTLSVDQFCGYLCDRVGLSADILQKSTEQWRAETRHPTSAESLADWLIGKGLISEFHAEALLSGIEGPVVIGPYEVAEQLASGSLGGVYRARHRNTGQRVSLKIFPSQHHTSREQTARINREVRLLAQLNHPNVVRAFDCGEAHGVRYVAFEELEGETLGAWLDRQGAMDFHHACRFALDIAEGLGVLHEQGIVNRDICPEAIWIDNSGRAKILEFGSAKDTAAQADGEGQGLTTDSAVIGRYDYMSPEQAKDARAVTAASDLFSLGATLYH